MNPNDVAPMVAMVTLTIVTGAVLLLRPLTRRLGDLIQLMIEERRKGAKAPPQLADPERIVDVLESIEARLARLEEKQTFTDAMLTGAPLQNRAQLPGVPTKPPGE